MEPFSLEPDRPWLMPSALSFSLCLPLHLAAFTPILMPPFPSPTHDPLPSFSPISRSLLLCLSPVPLSASVSPSLFPFLSFLSPLSPSLPTLSLCFSPPLSPPSAPHSHLPSLPPCLFLSLSPLRPLSPLLSPSLSPSPFSLPPSLLPLSLPLSVSPSPLSDPLPSPPSLPAPPSCLLVL